MNSFEDFFKQKGIDAWTFLPETAIRFIYSCTGTVPLPNRKLEETSGIAVLLPYRIGTSQADLQEKVQECTQTQDLQKSTHLDALEVDSVLQFKKTATCNDAGSVRLQIGSFAAYNYYHFLARILQELAVQLRVSYGWHRHDIRIAVNSGLPEKECAQLAGLGWIGKSGLLVNKDYGSAVIIGLMLYPKIDNVCVSFSPAARGDIDNVIGSCKTCTACITACPTHALDHGFERTLCLQYWMSRGGMPQKLKKRRGLRLYGCDNCIAVCPYTKRAQHHVWPQQNKISVSNGIEKEQETDQGREQKNQGGTHQDNQGAPEQQTQKKQQGQTLSFTESQIVYDFLESHMTDEEKRPGHYVALDTLTDMSLLELKAFFKGTALGMSWIPYEDFLDYIHDLKAVRKRKENDR